MSLLEVLMKRALRTIRIYHTFIVFILAGIAGCAVNTNQAPFPAQQWHDMNSHYNAHFNAKEQLKEVLKTVDQSHKDDFSEVIPVFSYTNPKEFAGASGELESMEKRSEKSLRIHAYSNYADDHFLLIGIANYLKGDYEKAITNFKFIASEYKDGVDYVKEMKRLKNKSVKASVKKKAAKKPHFEKVEDAKGRTVLQKIDERPSFKPFIHEPVRAEALIWLTKTYTSREQFSEAQTILQYAKNDDQFYRNLDKELLLAEADLYIRQKDYKQAVKPLEAYLTDTKGKKKRLRPLFALAQIYERYSKFEQAAEYYKQALKSNPTYDMEFFAKLQMTRISRKAKNIDLSEVKQLLAKMSRDGKYRDNFDQIYYELGEIALEERERPEARKYFRKSVAVSTTDAEQKSRSFLRLAQMDYAEEQYEASKFNYDSAVTGMSVKSPDYEATVRRGKVLSRLVEHLNIINAEDSLQRVAKMSPAERTKFIKKLIAAQEKERERLEKEKETAANAPATPAATASSGSSTWYFYNVQQRTKGYADFIKKWGKRKLEENWRRKDKTASSDFADAVSSDTAQADENAQANTGSEEEKALEGLPLTAEKVEQSNDKLIDAFYASGTIYKDDLINYKKATKQFETLLNRFPKNKLEPEAFFQLYLLAQKENDNTRMQYYRTKIQGEYPNSTMAKFLYDPNYFAKLNEQENAVSKYYESAYADYSKGLYASAAEKCRMSSVRYNPNPLEAKFDLLSAMINAKEQRLNDYVQALHKIVDKYNNTPEQAKAKELLSALNKTDLPQIDRAQPRTQAIQPEQPVVETAVTEKAEEPQAEKKEVTTTVTETPLQATTFNRVGDMKTSLSNRLGKLNFELPKEESKVEQPQSQSMAKPAEQAKQESTPVVKNEEQPKQEVVPVTKSEEKPKQETVTVVKEEKPKQEEVPAAQNQQPKDEKPVAENAATQNNNAQTLKKDTTVSKPTTVAAPKKETEAVQETPDKPNKTTKAEKTSTKTTEAKTAANETNKDTVSTAAAMTIKFDLTDTVKGYYGKSDAAPHQVIIIFKDSKQYNAGIIQKLEQFEQSKYEFPAWINRNVDLDFATKIVAVKPFKNKQEAISFITQLEVNTDESIGVPREQVLIYAISLLNYSNLINSKRIGNYDYFYRENYKK